MISYLREAVACAWEAVATFQWSGNMYIRWVIPTDDTWSHAYPVDGLKDLDYMHTSPAYRDFGNSHDCEHYSFSTLFPLHSGRNTWPLSTDEVAVSAFLTQEDGRSYWNFPPYEEWVGVTNTNYYGMQVKQGRKITRLQENVYLVDQVIKTGFIDSPPYVCTWSCQRQLLYWRKYDGVSSFEPSLERVIVGKGSRTWQGQEALAAWLTRYDRTFAMTGAGVDYHGILDMIKDEVLDGRVQITPSNGCYFSLFPPTDKQIAEVRRFCKDYRHFYETSDIYQRPLRKDFGRAVAQALADIKYVDINSIAYLKEAVEAMKSGQLIAELDPLKDFVTSPSLKNLANLTLSYSYGTRLTVADTVEIEEGVKKLYDSLRYLLDDTSTVKGWASQSFPDNFLKIERLLTANVYYHQQQAPVRKLMDALYKADLEPSLGNIYDLIPYSFVVDWFVNVGDILESIDVFATAAYLNLAYYIRSYKDVGKYPVSLTRYGTDRIDFSHYVREVRESLDIPVPDLEVHLPGVSVLPQGLALVVQRLL